MIIDSTAFATIPGLISAVLTENADGTPSQLNLTWVAGITPPEYQEPITIIHKGAVLFHGKATGTTFNNRAGDATTSTTAQNHLWLLDKQTLGDILGNTSIQDAARRALSSWENLAESINVTANGWTVNPDGTPKDAQDHITLSTPANPGISVGYNRKSPCSALQALQKRLQANPGTYATVDYTTGQIKLLKRSELPESTLHTLQHHITEISGITPNYDDMPAGIAVIVSWDLEYLVSEGAIVTGKGEGQGKAVRIFPPDLSADSIGIRVFTRELHLQTFTGGNHDDDCQQEAEEEADRMLQQLLPWFQEATTPAVTGDVTTLMSDWQASPIATRLSMSGPGSVDTLDTPVTSVDWDFMALTTTLHLGHAYGEPKLSQLARIEQEFHPRSTSSAEPGDFTFSNRSDSSEESTAENTGTGTGTGTGSQGSQGSQGPGSDGPGSHGSQGPGSQDPQACGCEPKWQALEARLAALEAAGGGCNCQCGDLMERIQAAIDAAVAGVQVQASLTQPLETTETGQLNVTGNVTANSRGGNSQVDAHYN